MVPLKSKTDGQQNMLRIMSTCKGTEVLGTFSLKLVWINAVTGSGRGVRSYVHIGTLGMDYITTMGNTWYGASWRLI